MRAGSHWLHSQPGRNTSHPDRSSCLFKQSGVVPASVRRCRRLTLVRWMCVLTRTGFHGTSCSCALFVVKHLPGGPLFQRGTRPGLSFARQPIHKRPFARTTLGQGLASLPQPEARVPLSKSLASSEGADADLSLSTACSLLPSSTRPTHAVADLLGMK